MKEHRVFYEALPKHKAELIDGKMYVGGSLAKSAMMLGYMVENMGAETVLKLCPKELLQAAVIEVYGKGQPTEKPLADFEPLGTFYFRPQKLATDLRLSLFQHRNLLVSGGTTAIKIGKNVLMPDVYVIGESKLSNMTDYYLEGAPDFALEVVHPYMRTFDYGVRLEQYAKAGLGEVWMLDYEKRSFEPYLLKDGDYKLQIVEGDYYTSKTTPTITVAHKRLYESAEEFGNQLLDIFEVKEEGEKIRWKFKRGYAYGSVPFAPRLDLEPVAITFPEFIAWGGEVKFEMMNGIPLFGGSEQTTLEWLGLLMMTWGMKETVKYLPKEEWSAVL